MLQPFKENCDGLLTSSPIWAPIRQMIDAAWSTCPTTCSTDAAFSSYMSGLNAACCPDGVCRGGQAPTSCDATCAAVLLPLRRECFHYLDLHQDVKAIIDNVALMCPGGAGLGADPCSPNPCFNGGACVPRAPAGGGHRRTQAGGFVDPFTCTCLAGFSGSNCELSAAAGGVGHTGDACEPRLPSIINTLIHALDPGLWKRIFAAIASISDELSVVDWAVTGTSVECTGGNYGGYTTCADHSSDDTDCFQFPSNCFWQGETWDGSPSCTNVDTDMAEEDRPYIEFCSGVEQLVPEQVIDADTSAAINEVLVAARDATAVLGDQLPDSDVSVHLPPAVLDLDIWILEALEGDWHTAFGNMATLQSTLAQIDWNAIMMDITDGQPCGLDCDQYISVETTISQVFRKMADALTQRTTPPEQAGNWCRISDFSLTALAIAAADVKSFKATVQTLHDFSISAAAIDWQLQVTNPDDGSVEDVIDHDTSAEIQSMLQQVGRVTQIVLDGMPNIQARAPTSRTLGDVWDWLIDVIGSDWEGIGHQCQSLATSLQQVDWAQVMGTIDEETTFAEANDFASDMDIGLGLVDGMCAKLATAWPPSAPPLPVCKTWMFSPQDFFFENVNPPELKKLLRDASSILTNAATIDWSFSHTVDGCDESSHQAAEAIVNAGFVGLNTPNFDQLWRMDDRYFCRDLGSDWIGVTPPGYYINTSPDDVCGPAIDGGLFEDGYTCPTWDDASWTPDCIACRQACVQKYIQEKIIDPCGDYNYGYDREGDLSFDGQMYPDFLDQLPDRCCSPAVPPHTQEMISADDSRGVNEALSTAASVLTQIGASLPVTNDEDPNSSPYDLDGWLDDFALADFDTIFSQAGVLFTSLSSVDWATIGDPFTDSYSLELQSDAGVAALFASIPEVHAAKTPASQTCVNVLPALDGVLASLMNPKRYKDILQGVSTLLTKITRIDWDSPMQAAICTRPTPNCAQFADLGSCEDAVVHPNLDPCPASFIDDGGCDETAIQPGVPYDPADQQQRVGLCAAGTDTNDCQNGGREQEMIGAYDEMAVVGKCTWVQQGPGDAADPATLGTCTWMPEKGCMAWTQATSYAGSPLDNADLGPGGPIASVIPTFEQLAAAFPNNTPDPTPATWLDLTGWALGELTGDWAGVGAQCVRFADAFSAVDWNQIDFDIEEDAAAVDKNVRADDQRAEFDRTNYFAVRTHSPDMTCQPQPLLPPCVIVYVVLVACPKWLLHTLWFR